MRPEPVPFDPSSDSLPSPLESAINESAASILLLVAAEPDDASVRAAVGLAEARSASGLATVLADAAFAEPRLHAALGVDNLEGLADVFLFGASLEGVRTRPEGRSFDFVPAGAYVPDPAGVLSSGQWGRVGRELEAEDARLLLFVPADAEGLGILSSRVGEALLIGSGAALDRATPRLAPGCSILAVIDPASAAPARTPGDGEADLDAVRAALAEAQLSEPVVFRTDRKSRRAVSPVLLLLLAAAVLAGAWFVYQEYLSAEPPAQPVSPPVESPAGPAPEEPAVAQADAEPQPEPEPVETPLAYSVAVEAHADFGAALERARDLRAAAPDIGFYIAPLAIRGNRFYRVLAGPVRDSAAAATLMDRLVEQEIKTAAQDWDLRPTDRAFLVGEFPSEAEADARVRELAEMDVPAYVAPIRYEPGPARYRVWAGAYENEPQGDVMREMLSEAGVEARMEPRIGEPIGEGS